ncbi:MAG: hypothetical protein K940chlam3_00890, partial [Chlamydiae bacterium]|nr:hypothetical protein [Chlamydiota bacterium]
MEFDGKIFYFVTGNHQSHQRDWNDKDHDPVSDTALPIIKEYSYSEPLLKRLKPFWSQEEWLQKILSDPSFFEDHLEIIKTMDAEFKLKIARKMVKKQHLAEILIQNIDALTQGDEAYKRLILSTILPIGFGGCAVVTYFDKLGIDDLKTRHSFALTIAMDRENIVYGESTCKALILNLEKFGFRDSNFLKRLATELVKNYSISYFLVPNIRKFCVKDSDLKEMALWMAGEYWVSKAFVKHFDQLGFESDFLKILALKLLEKERISELASNIDKFHFMDLDFKLKIVEACFLHKERCRALLKNIRKFNLDDNRLQKLAIRLANSSFAAIFADFIDQFNFKKVDFKKKIAQELCKTNCGAKGLARNFEKFGFKNLEFCLKLVTKIIQYKDGAGTFAENIESFTYFKSHILRKLALSIIEYGHVTQTFVKNIDCFGLTEEELIQVALQCVETEEGAAALAVYFKKFPIEESEIVTYFAFKIVKYGEGAKALILHFENFHFDDPDSVKKLAREMIKHRNGAEELAKNLHKFGFDDVKFLENLALEGIRYGAGLYYIMSHLKEFGFEDQESQEALAWTLVKSDGAAHYLGEFFGIYDIHDRELISRIGWKMTESSTRLYCLINFFIKHDLVNQEFLTYIIKRIEKSPPECIADAAALLKLHINFRFVDEKTKQDLLLKWAKHRYIADEIAKKIQKFGFHDQEFLKLLALELGKHQSSAFRLVQYLAQFNFEDDSVRETFENYRDLIRFTSLEMEERKKLMLQPLSDWKMAYGRVTDLLSSITGLMPKALKNDNQNHLDIIKKYFQIENKNHPNFDQFNDAWKVLLNLFKNESFPTKPLQHLRRLAVKYDPLFLCLDDLIQIEDSNLQDELALWMYHAISRAALCLSKGQIDLFHQTKILKVLYRLRDMDLRYDLIKKFVSQVQSLSDKRECQKFIQASRQSQNSLLVRLMLLDLKKKNPEISPNPITYFSRKLIHDGNKLSLLLKGLLHLEKSIQIGSAQIAQCLNYFSRLPNHRLCEELNALNALCVLEKENKLSLDPESSVQKQIFSCLKLAFEELLPGLALENPERFERVFFGERHPEALLVYMSGCQMLSPEDLEKMQGIVRDFIQDVDRDQFQENRYEDSEHLEIIFASREGLKDQWKKGHVKPLRDYLPDTSTEGDFDLAEYLKCKVDDGHLPMEEFPQFAVLLGYSSKRRRVLRYSELDDLLVDLFRNPESFTTHKLREIEHLLRELSPESEFLNDIVELKQMLKPSADRNVDAWMLVNSDDPLDLFLAGTEVSGSCQRVGGSACLNKGLMGYVMDGKHRIIAIKDEHNKIVGRSIFRLLFDEKNQTPVLYYECVYPGTLKSEYKGAMQAFANECAED